MVYRYQRDSEYADFSQREIFHLKGFGFTGLVGLSPIAFACKSAGVAVAMEDQQRDFFANGAKSPQILMTGDRVLTEPQRNQLEENFKEIAGGPVKTPLDSGSGIYHLTYRRNATGCRDDGVPKIPC